MKIKDVMHDITLVDAEATVQEVARVMTKKNIGSVLIERKGIYYILTERDILYKVVAEALDPSQIKAEKVMTPVRYTIDAEASVEKASIIFSKHRIRRLPVMHRGEIVGIVTARSIARACSK